MIFYSLLLFTISTITIIIIIIIITGCQRIIITTQTHYLMLNVKR